MVRKIYLFIAAFIAFSFAAIAQNNQGTLKVTVTDKKTKEAIPFANAVVMNGKVQVAAGTADFDGNIIIKPLASGKYTVKVVYIGYQAQQFNDVLVTNDKTTYLTPVLANEGVDLNEIPVTEYKVPLIDPDTKTGGTTTREQFQQMANKSLNAVVSTQAGVYQQDNGSAINVRGSRSSSTNVFIDGERAIGTQNIPQQAVDQISVVLGGLPAQYGDVTGGVISVTTRGPQPKFFGGIEAVSSQLTDKYGYNFLGFSVGGPILNKKDSAGKNERPILGFFLGGEVVYQKDPSPWANGIKQVNKDKLSKLEASPLQYNPLSGTYYLASGYLNNSDMYTSAVRPNVASKAIRLSPKIDFAPTPNLNITLGGSWDYNNYHSFVYEYALLNSQHNPQTIDNTMRGYIRLTQKFGSSSSSEQEKSQSLFKRAFFTVQAGYQRYTNTVQDEQFKNNYFDYGYVGKFNEYRAPHYAFNNTVKVGDTVYNNVYTYLGDYDTSITFSPGTTNPLTANYTTQLMNSYAANGVHVSNYSQIYQNNGLRNGDVPQSVHSLWYNTGRAYGGYTKTEQSIFRITSNFSADIKNHSIMIGVEFDQRNERGYNVQTRSLWGTMRQLANQHNTGLLTDSTSAASNYHAPGTFGGTGVYYTSTGGVAYNAGTANGVIGYPVKYDTSQQSVFSKNVYDQIMGIHNGMSTAYINIDQYDPSKFNMGMFSPDELLNGGVALVDAYGYDYTGKRLAGSGKVAFNDFLNKFHMDKFNDTIHDRLQGAFRPVYMAGYIQDKFDFKDIKFNIGLRIDRYDANQMVLKDKYLLKEAYHVSDLTSQYASQVPSSIPSTAVVYVADNNSSTKSLVGYRDGDNWYDASGNAVSDPKIIAEASNGQAQPWLVNPSDKKPYENAAFTQYKPQINVMPRVAFSFPISDVANFFAHYDILTQRPSSAYNRMNPKDWYFMSANQGGVLANPNLKPERVIDYELGFSQILNEKKNAALKITAFYREMRNLQQITRVNQAYPLSYLTYGNIDFSTVKGFSAEFQLRRTGGVQFSANYTMQFAEGSGSNANGGYNLASTSQPNLRVITPLDFDQRHTLTANFDYRFGAGKDYRGPQTTFKEGGKTWRWLEDVGFNFVSRLGSGTPYTRRYPPAPDEEFGQNISQFIYGDLNGSRFPWQFRTDLRVDKNFTLSFGKEESKRTTNLNVYFQILNLFNTKNVINVHNYTGSPTDDGYLASNFGINEINQKYTQGAAYASAFQDQYNAKLNDGRYYSLPRQFRIGLQFDF
ncbi:MAG TPA: TonB-dependent receptor [Bacteroidia bacterium]|nr:TonB-dependent receptor [Bacteroidia bacterium]